METFLIILGILIYVLTTLDVVQTTLSMQGGGWLTSRLAHWFWEFIFWISGKDGRNKILSHAGYFLLVVIIFTWVLLLMTSLVLLLSSEDASILNSKTRLPTDLVEKIYYAGFTLSTLGVGDYIASTNVWRVVTTIYSFTGLILITMSITYFLPALSAVIQQRVLGIQLRNLGNSPEEILLNSWDGEDFSDFTDMVSEISESLVEHSQNHRAYPVIHYFHNWKEKNAIILQLARLHEALYLLKYEIDERYRPKSIKLKPLEVAFENYREVITEVTHIKVTDDAPPLAGIEALKEKGLVPRERSKVRIDDDINDTRKLFQTLVRQDGWTWELVSPLKSS